MCFCSSNKSFSCSELESFVNHTNMSNTNVDFHKTKGAFGKSLKKKKKRTADVSQTAAASLAE